MVMGALPDLHCGVYWESGWVKILHIITTLSTGGAELMLLKFLERTSLRHKNHVISLTTAGDVADRIRTLGVSVESLGLRVTTLPKVLWRLAIILHKNDYDVIQTWLYHSDFIGFIIARLVGAQSKIVWNVRCSRLTQNDVPVVTRLCVRILAKLSSCPDAVIYNSEAGRIAHEELGYCPRKCIVIPNGFDLTEWRPDAGRRSLFRRELGISEQVPLVGMVARFHPMKDHSTFFAAAAQIVSQLDGVRFVLAGNGITWDNQSLVHDIERHCLRDHVYLLGLHHDISTVMAALDCCVSTSTSEGFPNVIGEAMACGVPCVATDVGDSRVIIGDTGWLVPVLNSTAIAVAVVGLLIECEAEKGVRRVRCRNRIEEMFCLDSVVSRYVKFYGELDGRSQI